MGEFDELLRDPPTAQELELEALRRRVKNQRAELRRLAAKDQMAGKVRLNRNAIAFGVIRFLVSAHTGRGDDCGDVARRVLAAVKQAEQGGW